MAYSWTLNVIRQAVVHTCIHPTPYSAVHNQSNETTAPIPKVR